MDSKFAEMDGDEDKSLSLCMSLICPHKQQVESWFKLINNEYKTTHNRICARK